MKDRFKTIKAIHIALCSGVGLAYIFIGDLQTLRFLELPKLNATAIPFLLIPVAAIFIGNLLYRQQLKNSDPALKPEEKVALYQTASLIRWALLEGAAFVILFIKPEFMIIGLLVVVYMLVLRPSEEAMIRDFNVYKS